MVVRSALVPADSPAASAPLLSLVPPGPNVAWVHADAGLVGWGVAAEAEFSGAERFSRAQRWWHQQLDRMRVDDDLDLPGTGPVAFASFAFDKGPSVVVVPQVVVGRRGGTTWVTSIGDADEPLPQPSPAAPQAVHWHDGTLGEQRWGRAVQDVVARIGAGEVDKVVLARDIVAEVDGPIDERYLLEQLQIDYPQCWTFHVGGLVGATPELLVQREGTAVRSRVLAGTVRRAGRTRADTAAAAALLGSGKDLAEHEYAVQSVAEALARHCTDLDVPAGPVVLPLANVQHLATDIAGTLADSSGALALAASLHPTAAVCGTPTERALDIIASVEGMDRGRYAGPVGWFDARGDGEFGIALRCGQIDRDRREVRLFAGCGLVAGSTAEAEIAESAAKFAAMRAALSTPR